MNEVTQLKQIMRFQPRKAYEILKNKTGNKFISSELEEIYWSSALTSCSIRELSSAIIDRFAPSTPYNHLVSSEKKVVDALRKRFYDYAIEQSTNDHSAQNHYDNHPVLLPEILLEGNQLIPEAFSLYILNHDSVIRSIPLSDERKLILLVLRFKASSCLYLLDKNNIKNKKTAISLLGLSDRIFPEIEKSKLIPPERIRTYRYISQKWAGFKNRELGLQLDSVKAFKLAAKNSDCVDDIIENICSASMSLMEISKQDALRNLESVQELLDDAGEENKEVWKTLYNKLNYEISEKSVEIANRGNTGFLFSTIRTWLQKGKLPSKKRTEKITNLINEQLDNDANKYPVDEHASLLLQITPFLVSKDLTKIEELLSKAEQLEVLFADQKPKLRRSILSSRKKMYKGEDVSEEFSNLINKAKTLFDNEELLDTYRYYFEAVAQSNQYKILDLITLTNEVKNLLLLEIFKQPNATARKRVREFNQVLIETMVFALLAYAEKYGLQTGDGQKLLLEAIYVILATRNIELYKSKNTSHDIEHSLLENRFFSCLDQAVLHDDYRWKEPLEALFDYESKFDSTKLLNQDDSLNLSSDYCSIILFVIHDLFNKSILCCFTHIRQTIYLSVIDDYDVVLKIPFESWLLSIEPNQRTSNNNKNIDNLTSTLSKIFANINKNVGHSDIVSQEKLIKIFPDHETSGLCLDSLSLLDNCHVDTSSNITIGLMPPKNFESRIDFNRSFLGLTGIPEYGRDSGYLEQSIKELDEISKTLQSLKTPVVTLKHEKATTVNLKNALSAFNPSIIHFAAHGFGNSQYPVDISHLVLAKSSVLDEYSLLSYREIINLTLNNVDLVVLSVCSGAIGSNSRGDITKNLVGAFLLAGTKSVVASRYPVDDTATRVIMTTFYQYLIKVWSPSEALSLAKKQCLDDGIGKYQIAAWSLYE